jgi:cytochrome c556
MNRSCRVIFGVALLLLLVVAAPTARTASRVEGSVVSGQDSGWTGVTNPKDVITARQELMEHIEELMEPIDTITVKEITDVGRLHTNAEVIGAMLLALPHLFPPTTNLYDPQAAIPATLALPAIWKDWGTFYNLAAASAKAADAMAAAKGKEQLRTASLRLRGSCDACHALNLRAYVSPKILDSDRKFDFESARRKM